MRCRILRGAILASALVAWTTLSPLSAVTHTVTLSQTDDADPVCTVDPPVLFVASGDDVEFDMVTDGKAKKVKIKKKKNDPDKVTFGNPPPWEASKGKPASSGAVRKAGGDRWTYDAVFKRKLLGIKVCTVDPIICIKDDEAEASDADSSAKEDAAVDDPCT